MGQQVVSDKSSPAETHSLMILTTSERMRDAYANNNREQFFRYFTSALQMLAPAMGYALKQRLEEDHKKLLEVIQQINNGAEHSGSKKEKVINLQFMFAEKHQMVIYSTMARTDIFRPRAEGSVDFNKYDIAILAEAVKQKGKNDDEGAIEILKDSDMGENVGKLDGES